MLRARLAVPKEQRRVAYPCRGTRAEGDYVRGYSKQCHLRQERVCRQRRYSRAPPLRCRSVRKYIRDFFYEKMRGENSSSCIVQENAQPKVGVQYVSLVCRFRDEGCIRIRSSHGC